MPSVSHRILALALLACAPQASAVEALLIPEVITREVGIHVGGVQTPEIQSLVTREVGLFVDAEPEPPYRQVASREVSLAVGDAAPPPRMEKVVLTLSPSGDTVKLDWTGYDQWSVRDVMHYAVYMSDHAITSLEGLVPRIVPGEQFSTTFTDLPAWKDSFYAVVPVDVLGQYDTGFRYFGAYVLMPEVATREVGFFNGAEPDPPYRQVETREVGLAVGDAAPPPRTEKVVLTLSPTGDTVKLDWTGYDQWAVRDVKHYAVYMSDHAITSLNGLVPRIVPGEQFSTTFTGLPAWQDSFYAVVPVDVLGNYDTGFRYFGAYVLMPEVATREVGFFNGAEPDPPYRMVETREVGLVVADDTTPLAVTGSDKGFRADVSRARFGGVNLDWSDYNLWSQRDVVRYRIYYSSQFFSDVRAPGVTFAGISQDGQATAFVGGLTQKQVFYFAVVAEDSMGNYDPLVYSRSTKEPIPDLFEYALNIDGSGGGTLQELGITWAVQEEFIEYHFSRRVVAVDHGTSYDVEWSDDMLNWSTAGVVQEVVSDDGTNQDIRATVPRDNAAKRFVRLKIVAP